MKIIAYRPEKDLFWIGCTKEEAEKFFIPLIGKEQEVFWPNFLARMQEGYPDGSCAVTPYQFGAMLSGHCPAGAG